MLTIDIIFHTRVIINGTCTMSEPSRVDSQVSDLYIDYVGVANLAKMTQQPITRFD